MFLNSFAQTPLGDRVAETKKGQAQTKVQKIFSKLCPASWFSRKKETPQIPVLLLTEKAAPKAQMQRGERQVTVSLHMAEGNSCLTEAKRMYDSMFEMVRSHPDCPSEELLGKFELIRASIHQAEGAYKKARDLSTRDSDAFEEAVALLSQSRKLYQRALGLSLNSQILEASLTVLKHDALAYPYLSGKAQKSAISLLEMLERNVPLAEILTEFTPSAGFSSTAKREAHKLFRIMGETPVFEPYIQKIVKEYCEKVSARET